MDESYCSTPCSRKRLISASKPKQPLTLLSIISSFFPRHCSKASVTNYHCLTFEQRNPSKFALQALSLGCLCGLYEIPIRKKAAYRSQDVYQVLSGLVPVKHDQVDSGVWKSRMAIPIRKSVENRKDCIRGVGLVGPADNFVSRQAHLSLLSCSNPASRLTGVVAIS